MSTVETDIRLSTLRKSKQLRTNLLGAAESHHRRGLGETVAFNDFDVDVLEEIQHVHRSGCSSDKAEFEVASKPVPDFAQHRLYRC